MPRLPHLLLPLALAALPACFRGARPAPNPPAPGFDLAGSDAAAIEVADDVMEALGGRERWDAARLISWSFFGRRRLLWDKHTGDVRIDYLTDDAGLTVAFNVDSRQGRAWRGAEEVRDAAELAGLIQAAYAHWVNDSYWLVMPYKLKDSGVTLRWGGRQTDAQGRSVDVLVLTFQGVGVTPQNKYEVYVSPSLRLVVGWSYYEKAADAEPRFTLPWLDWRWYGGIQLSGNRGDRQLTDIQVLTEPPPGMMTAPTAR